MTPKKEENMTLTEVEQALLANEEEKQRLLNLKKRKKREEYVDLCRQIAEFVLDLSDLDSQTVKDFKRRMAEKKYEMAAKILTHELSTAAENAPTRAARKDAELAQKRGKKSPEMKAGAGA
jgi:hypothetical protein